MSRALILLLVILATPALAGLEWFPPRFDGDRIAVVPEPHYNTRDKIGISVQAIRAFRTGMQSELSDDSEFQLLGRIHATGNGAAEARATIRFGEGRWFLNSRVMYRSLIERFWGLGPDTPASDEELYRPQQVLTYVELFRRVTDGFRMGVRVEWNDFKYVDVESGGLLATRDYPGLCCDNATGFGLVLEYDTRDDVYDPGRGIHAQGFVMNFSEDLQGDYDFRNAYFDVRTYHRLGRGDTIATQVFTYALYGSAPIWRYAAIGGREHSRGYQRGRYLDRRMLAAQVEWRRRLTGRLGSSLFAGAATVDDVFDNIKVKTLRPTVGAGLLLHVTEGRGLTLRGDFAFGQSSVEGYLKFGHAF